MSRRYSLATITLVILFCGRPHCRKISVRQYYQKRVFFIQQHFSALRLKNASFLYGISSFHHDVFDERWTQYICAVSSGWIPWSGACGLMLQQSLGHLDATIIYPMAWNRNQSIPAVYIVNWVQRWVTTCAWGTVWKWTLAEGGCAQRICRW